jgi:hypothetical protein
MRFILIIVLALLYASCVSGQKEKQNEHIDQEAEQPTEEYADFLTDMERDFIGEWRNVSMRIWVKTYNQSDTSFIVDINEENWDMKMTIEPIITNVYEDGTYISEFRNSFDSLIYMPEGTWLIDGDSLFMEDHQAVYKYKIFIDGDRAEFNSIVDWDGDGEVDDEYFGVQRKTQ